MAKVTLRLMGGTTYTINTNDDNGARDLVAQLNVLRENQVKTISKKDGAPYDISIRGQFLVAVEYVPSEAYKSDAEKELEELRKDVAVLKAKKLAEASDFIEKATGVPSISPSISQIVVGE